MDKKNLDTYSFVPQKDYLLLMVKITKKNEVYLKILLWGASGSGKTSFLDVLDEMVRKENKDIVPRGNLTKIQTTNGATLYFDRGVFQSTLESKLFYLVYTVAGRKRFFPLRKKTFEGSDGVIFIFDARPQFFNDNIESLEELVELRIKGDFGYKKSLIKDIPLIVMLNKRVSTECITKKEIIQILKEKGLWFEPNHKLYIWNPIIYETAISFENRSEIYDCFSECARRSGIYLAMGNGKAPFSKKFKGQKKDLIYQNQIEDLHARGPQEFVTEESLTLLIIAPGGIPVFSYSFSNQWKNDNEIFGCFISAFTYFTDEVFSKEFNGAKFGDNTLLIQLIESFSICYLFKGHDDLAYQRLTNFTKQVQNNNSLCQKINKFYNTSQVLELKDSPSLKSLINGIFISKKPLIDRLGT